MKKIIKEALKYEIINAVLIIITSYAVKEMIIHHNEMILIIAITARIVIEQIINKRYEIKTTEYKQTIRKKLHEALMRQETGSAEVLTLTFETLANELELLRRIVPEAAKGVILIPLIIIVSIILDLKTAVIFILTIPIAPLLMYLIGKTVKQRNESAMKAITELNGTFKEMIMFITTLKIYKRDGTKQVETVSKEAVNKTLEVLKMAFVSAFALEMITTLSIALVAVTVGLRLVSGDIEFEAAMLLLILAPEIYAPLRRIGTIYHTLVAGIEARQKIKEYIKYEDKTKHKYEIAKKIYVILGESGSGKTTLLRKLANMMNNVAYMAQEPHIFKANVYENVTLFKAEDTTKIKDMIKTVGLKTKIYSEAVGLSRGEVKRIGLIRALIQEKPILILDEPTAGLDEANELKVLNLLKEKCKNCTIIIATHRAAVKSIGDEYITLD